MDYKKMSIKKLSQNLKRERQLKEYTLRELEYITGVNRQTISNIECGKNVPTLLTIIKIANGLEIKLDDLLY